VASSAPGAAQAEHRHANHVGAKTKLGHGAGFQAWRGNPGGGHRHDGIDLASRQPGALKRLGGGLDEQRQRARFIGGGAGGPVMIAEIPGERLAGAPLHDAGGEEYRRDPVEILEIIAEHHPRRFDDLTLMRDMLGNGCCDRKEGDIEPRSFFPRVTAGFRLPHIRAPIPLPKARTVSNQCGAFQKEAHKFNVSDKGVRHTGLIVTTLKYHRRWRRDIPIRQRCLTSDHFHWRRHDAAGMRRPPRRASFGVAHRS
jgi:hypothetical protein